MQFPKKISHKLKEISSKGETVYITLKNHLNQTLVLEGVIPNYYEFKDGRFPNLSVGRDFVMLKISSETVSTKVTLPTPMLALKKIETKNEILFENTEFDYEAYCLTHWISDTFGTVNKFSLKSSANTLAKQYVGKIVIYNGTKIPDLIGKGCLITALSVDADKDIVHFNLSRGKIFNNTKITMSIEEFNNTFTLDEAIKELN